MKRLTDKQSAALELALMEWLDAKRRHEARPWDIDCERWLRGRADRLAIVASELDDYPALQEGATPCP